MTPPPPLLLPKALAAGDAVAVISPAGPTRERAHTDEGVEKLRSWGLKPTVFPHAFDLHGYLAGNDEARLADLQNAISDSKWRAIFCIRGGYGVTRLLERLDFRPLLRDPKPIVGYSDITALLLGARETVGLVGFHGAMVASYGQPGFSAESENNMRRLLFGETFTNYPPNPGETLPHVLKAGAVEGPLVGGNLSLLSALAGTPWAPRFTGALAFIEDVEEPPYRIDRMLTQLLQATDLRRAAGIILGDFAKADAPDGTETTDLMWVLKDRLGSLGIPAGYGFPFGHRPKQWTLPIGVRARLEADDAGGIATLKLLGPAVRRR